MDELFFELIRIAIGKQDCLTKEPTAEEWQFMFDQAKRQALLGICFVGVRRLKSCHQTLPRVLFLKWLTVAFHIQQKNEQLNNICIELQHQLFQSGLRSSILKGQGIAQYYDRRKDDSDEVQLSLFRQSGDIDVYVDCGRERAIAYARSLGQENIEWDYKHLHLKLFKKTEVEMHYRVEVLLNLWKNRKLQRWFKEHEDLLFSKQGDLVTPSDAFNTFYILLHIYRHFLYEGVGLRQLMDYYFVCLSFDSERSPQIDIQKTLEQFGMMRFARGIMWILQFAFGLEDEKMLCKPLEREGRFILEEVMAGGNFGHYDVRLAHKAGRLNTFSSIISHNTHLLMHYPADVILAPFWFVFHRCWKIINQ